MSDAAQDLASFKKAVAGFDEDAYAKLAEVLGEQKGETAVSSLRVSGSKTACASPVDRLEL